MNRKEHAKQRTYWFRRGHRAVLAYLLKQAPLEEGGLQPNENWDWRAGNTAPKRYRYDWFQGGNVAEATYRKMSAALAPVENPAKVRRREIAEYQAVLSRQAESRRRDNYWRYGHS